MYLTEISVHCDLTSNSEFHFKSTLHKNLNCWIHVTLQWPKLCSVTFHHDGPLSCSAGGGFLTNVSSLDLLASHSEEGYKLISSGQKRA